MPAPTGTFQRPDLGLIFQQFDARDELGFIAQDVCPVFETGRQSANYSVIPATELLQDGDLTRGPGGGYKRTDYKFTQDNFNTQEYGLEEPIDDRLRQIYIYSFDVEKVAVDRLRMRFLRNWEAKVASLLQDTTNTFTGAKTAAAATKWSTPSSAAPIDDVRSALISLRNNCGLNPRNAAGVCDWETYQYLKDSSQILQVIKYGGRDEVKRGDITADEIAAALGLRTLYVAGSIKSTVDRGQALSLSSIWDKTKFGVYHLARSNDLSFPCVARTFAWSGDGANAMGVMEEYREEQTRSQIIRCRSEFHAKITYAAAGFVITGVE